MSVYKPYSTVYRQVKVVFSIFVADVRLAEVGIFFCGHGCQLDQEQDIPSHFNGSDVHRCGECVGRCPSHDKTWESIWGTFVMMNGMQKLFFMIAPVEGRIVESGHSFLKYNSLGILIHFFFDTILSGLPFRCRSRYLPLGQ